MFWLARCQLKVQQLAACDCLDSVQVLTPCKGLDLLTLKTAHVLVCFVPTQEVNSWQGVAIEAKKDLGFLDQLQLWTRDKQTGSAQLQVSTY